MRRAADVVCSETAGGIAFCGRALRLFRKALRSAHWRVLLAHWLVRGLE